MVPTLDCANVTLLFLGPTEVFEPKGGEVAEY